MSLGLFFGAQLERCVEFQAGWIAQVYAFNLVSVIVVAGGLHLYFYTFKRQGVERRIDPSEHGKNNPKFVTGHQVWDNVLYTCVSGVTVWTAYTVVFMWAYANNMIPWLVWGDSPLGVVWFLLLFPLLVLWESFHFYLVHRLLHVKFLYRWHAPHHRNINIGPWSGFSMHPFEHLLYFSNILIHLVVASHPIHMLYNMYFTALAASTAHTGYSSLVVNGKEVLDLGNFHHQLHHRYFDCNYGTESMPWDKWFGSFHGRALLRPPRRYASISSPSEGVANVKPWRNPSERISIRPSNRAAVRFRAGYRRVRGQLDVPVLSQTAVNDRCGSRASGVLVDNGIFAGVESVGGMERAK